jgi:pSer/pThr/pTyr-binding forkhead associated (FHA) protein
VASIAERFLLMMELHVCNRGGALLKAFALGESREVIVGRDETCDVRILAKSVSREHCAIEQEGHDLFLRDLGSTGGTFMEGHKVERIRLQDGMEFLVGPAVLKFFESGI